MPPIKKSAPARIGIGTLSIGDNVLMECHRGLLIKRRVVVLGSCRTRRLIGNGRMVVREERHPEETSRPLHDEQHDHQGRHSKN
jgi:hypothetical protein